MIKNKITAAMLLLMLTVVLTVSASAIEPIDMERESRLAVWFHAGETDLPEVSFDLYRVAEGDCFAEFTLSGDFAEYPVKVRDLDIAGWKSTAETLSGYVQRDRLKPLDSGETGQNGTVTFPTEETVKLSPGLYLVLGERRSIGGWTYTPEPILIALPNRAAEEHQWQYEVDISPKYSRKPAGGGSENSPVNRKVLKVWNDGDSEMRPKSIQVQLLKDGEIEETVTLSEENGWRWSWTNLDSEAEWRVVEQETPEGYHVSVTREGITFVMTNTLLEDIADEPIPTEPGDRTEDLPDEPVPTVKPTLPQTGQLWWPVPLLACGGLVLFILGWLRKECYEG